MFRDWYNLENKIEKSFDKRDKMIQENKIETFKKEKERKNNSHVNCFLGEG